MNWLKRIFSSSRRFTIDNPVVIQSPRIGFLNLLDADAQLILDKDKKALGPIFSAMEESGSNPPICDVLLIYARVENDGHIAGTSDGLRDIIRKASAQIVIVASENDQNGLIAAGKPTGYGRANLVLTLKRKDPAFASFFQELFSKMYRGITMPMAWVELAPQDPRARHEGCPAAIFTAEISHILFK